MGAKDFFNKLIGLDDSEDYEISQEEIEREREKLSKSNSKSVDEEKSYTLGMSNVSYTEVIPPMNYSSSNTQGAKASMNQSGPFKMVVIEPKSLDECRKLVDNLRARKPVIINLERVETELARKMFDFLSGATYALAGNVQRVTQNIFIFAPNNVNINAKLDRSTEAEVDDSSNPWK